MIKIKTTALLLALFACSAMFCHAAPAAKAYQVTGKVVEMTDAKIVVEKSDGEKWEIDRVADTKCDDSVKVGDKVTVMYTMTAKSVAAKEAGAAEKKEKKTKK